MFSVQRFDGGGASGADNVLSAGSGSGSAGSHVNPLRPPVDRIALLNAKRAQEATAGSNALMSAAESKEKVQAMSSSSHIHPSRLAQSQVLRHSDKKIRSSLQPGAKDKTRAKQRYLNRKKERRKNREKTKKIKVKAASKAPASSMAKDALGLQDVSTRGGSSDSDDSRDDESDKGSEIKLPRKALQGNTAEEENVTSSSSASSVSEPETDEESSAEPRSAAEMQEAEKRALAAEAAVDAQEASMDGLQRFAAPRATFLASQRDLAAQGLPEGLARPKYVKPSLTATVQKSDTRALDSISDAMKARLAKMGITEWFAVQTAIIPLLLEKPLSFDLYPSPPLGDVCVSAPTGSGKTLSYAVPIVEVLAKRLHRRTRALILVPTRDLVHQVRETLTAVSRGTGLSIASLAGQQSFAHEQGQLVDMRNMPVRRNIPGLKPLVPGSEEEANVLAAQQRLLRGPYSAAPLNDCPEANADIVIATPGRLIDHLDQTFGFTLQHLRFLVVDEADRLLSQSFQEWLPRILTALDPKIGAEASLHSSRATEALAPSWLAQKRILESEQDGNVSSEEQLTASLPRRESGVQKLLFSATLTRDPARIVALDLRNADFISVEGDEERGGDKRKHTHDEGDVGDAVAEAVTRDWQDSFALPASLVEHMLVVAASEKPLQLLQLLCTKEPPLRHALCFTKSLEAAARLVRLIEYFQEARAERLGQSAVAQPFVTREYSSEQSAGERMRSLEAFKRQEIDLLVCSDVMARGIDLPSVRHVICYDTPTNMANYVHRVGRTARAGRRGDAWTLVETHEARHFTQMMRRAQRWDRISKERKSKPKTKKTQVDGQSDDVNNGQPQTDPQYAELQEDYKTALLRLERLYSRKRRAKQRG